MRPFDVDLSDRAKVDTFVQVLAASAPAPTHFIHLPALPVVNAKFKAFDQTRFDRDLEIQVHSAVRLCRAVLPAMAKARFGRVLFIQTSYTIGCPPKNTTAYVMAKSAIGGLVKSLAVEYARFGVTVNCVAPSMMETNFLKDTPDLIVQAAAEENPMGRNATPADVYPPCVPALRRGRLHHRRNAAGHGRFGHCLIQHSGWHASARMPPSSTYQRKLDMRLPLLNRPELYHHYYAGRGGVPQFAVAEQDGEYVSAAGTYWPTQSAGRTSGSASGSRPKATTAWDWN